MSCTFVVAATATATASTAALTLLAGCGSLGPTDSSTAEVGRAHGKLATAFSTCDEAALKIAAHHVSLAP